MTSASGDIEVTLSGRAGAFPIDVAFTAPVRGITAIFGRSGAGKTTLLRGIAGLHRLNGTLRIGDTIWQDAQNFKQPHHRAIGYGFQEPSLFSHLSVANNLRFGLRRAVKRHAGTILTFENVVELIGLGSLLDRAPARLSGGERQRVAIGRALLSQPKLLLMDEPLASLDRSSRDDILPYLEALHRNFALPIFYVSHDLAEVSRLADRMIVVERGRVIAEGPIGTILERLDLRPATGRFEAGVVVNARVVAHDPTLHMTRLEIAGQPLSMPQVNLATGSHIRLRIRARDVSLAIKRPEAISIRNILKGTVTEIAEEAGTAFAETLIDIGEGRLRARITREAVAELGLARGAAVYALIKSVSFDGQSVSSPPLS